MGSLFLSRLSPNDREDLIQKLYDIQNGKCFICEKDIDLKLNEIELDHVIPVSVGGKDDATNLAVTHARCNESKQDSNLRIARILSHYNKIREDCFEKNKAPNLNDIFKEYGGSKYNLPFRINTEKKYIEYSINLTGSNFKCKTRIYHDKLSGFRYFFCSLPIEYLFHDDKINPRSIGQNISKLIKEFYLKRPQLHISLGWMDASNSSSPVKIFDGQHKAAAQVLLGIKTLPVRIFISPDIDVLLTTNTNAGTSLRQVAFDKSVQRHLGSSLYFDRVERFQKETNRHDNDFSFSEKDLVSYYKGESREMKRYILDSIRDFITHHHENKLKDYIDFGGRKKDKPLSYSTVEKTFYSFFIFQDVLETPINYRLEEDENPREFEKIQILKLMNIVAEEIFIEKFDLDIGTSRIEDRIQKGEDIPEFHLAANRISKEEMIYNWLKYIEQIIKNYFIMQGKPIQEKKLFQYCFPQVLWERIRLFTRNLFNLPVWVNKELSTTIFGGKQNYDYWQTIFETGKNAQGFQVLAEPLDLMEMIKE